MTSTAPSPQQLAKTGRTIAVGIWACAGISMLTNLLNGTAVFHELLVAAGVAAWLVTVGTVVGLLTAMAVDASLIVVIAAAARMHSLGLTSRWGRVGHVLIALSSLGLNSGSSLVQGHYFLAVLHATCPVLIVLLSLIGQESTMEFARRIQDHEAAERAVGEAREREAQEREAREEARRLAVAEEEDGRRRLEQHQRALAAEAERAASANKRAADEAAKLAAETERRAEVARGVLARPHLVVDNTRRAGPTTTAQVGDRAQAWLLEQHRAGVPLDSDDPRVGPVAIAKAIDASKETCRKSHRRWKAAVLEQVRVLAELEEAAG